MEVMTHRENNAIELPGQLGCELTTQDLYLEIPRARAAIIESALREAGSLPEPMAETLTLAAVALRHAVAAGFDPDVTGHALLVAELLTAEARRRDAEADAFAGRALDEMDSGDDTTGAMFLHESADSLAWACAVLRIGGAGHRSPRLAALAEMCVAEAAALLAAADRATIFEARRDA
jgi:hypothetical protein